MSAARPPEGVKAPSGGSATGEAVERGGPNSAAGPTEGEAAPSAGSEPCSAGSAGATTLALLLMFCALKGATFKPWLA